MKRSFLARLGAFGATALAFTLLTQPLRAGHLESMNAETKKYLELQRTCPESDVAKPYAACLKKQSDAGNGVASLILAEAYAGNYYNVESLKSLKVNQADSIRLALLAIRQGSVMALKFIPPGSYKWQVGMSDEQVRASIAGKPTSAVVNQTANSYVESWIYPSAVLILERSPISETHVVLKSITEQK